MAEVGREEYIDRNEMSGLAWFQSGRELMGGVERGISPPCQGENDAIHIQDVPGGMCQTSGECSLC